MKRFWTGVLAFAPLVSMIGYFVVFALILLVTFILGMAGVPDENALGSMAALALFVWMWLGIFIIVATDIADMIVFSIFAFKNQQIDITYRSLWCGAFLTFQMTAFPVYWWRYLRKIQ